jgi:hypothetical protein
MLKGISGRAMVHSSMLLTMLLITIFSLPAIKNVAKTSFVIKKIERIVHECSQLEFG